MDGCDAGAGRHGSAGWPEGQNPRGGRLLEMCRVSRLYLRGAGKQPDMKAALSLIAVGACALIAAIVSYGCGAAHLGTVSGTVALLVTGAGLALINQTSRARGASAATTHLI